MKYAALLGVFAIYSSSGIFSKLASQQGFMTLPYIGYTAGVVFVLGVYAILWQQIIKKVPLSTAYMFKCTSGIFGLLFALLSFKESFSLANALGAAISFCGVMLYSKS